MGLFPIVTAGHLQGNGLNAKEWVEYCIAGVGLGGKGGGKAVSSGGAGIFMYVCMFICMYAERKYELFLMCKCICENYLQVPSVILLNS